MTTLITPNIDKTSSLRDDLKKSGYSEEEAYFYHSNQELIDRKRKEIESKRIEKKENGVTSIHWMKCPKCGGHLNEVNLSGIFVDQCGDCEGLYFDRSEFETFMEAKKSEGFLGHLWSKLRDTLIRADTHWKP